MQPYVRFHGNGFVQIALGPDTRLHVYTPEFAPTVQNARIHDHKFVFYSQVLAGRLGHRTYTVTPLGAPEEGARQDILNLYPHGLWQQNPEPSKAAPLQKVGRCAVTPMREEYYDAGTAYRFGGIANYHDVWNAAEDDITVTLIRKVEVQPGLARIVALEDRQPDHAFEGPGRPSDEQLVEYAEYILAEMLGGRGFREAATTVTSVGQTGGITLGNLVVGS